MKVYVLTHCAAEENYTPAVFTTREAARAEMRQSLETILVDDNYDPDLDPTPEEYYNGQPIGPWVESWEEYADSCCVVYRDDTYDVLNIFEVEVME